MTSDFHFFSILVFFRKFFRSTLLSARTSLLAPLAHKELPCGVRIPLKPKEGEGPLASEQSA